jgi:hypothetical protein
VVPDLVIGRLRGQSRISCRRAPLFARA